MTISDVVSLLLLLFVPGSSNPPCPESGSDLEASTPILDFNADGNVDLTDAVLFFEHVVANGPPPALGTECAPIDGCPDTCLFGATP